MHKLLHIIAISLIVSFSSLAFATEISNAATLTAVFDPQTANQLVDELISELPNENVSTIKNAIKTINGLNAAAKKCVATNAQELDYVNKQLAVFKNETKTHRLIANKKALEAQRDHLTNLTSSCSLFSLRAEKTVSDFSQQILELSKNKLFVKYTPIWGNITLDMLQPSYIFQKFNTQQFLKDSGLDLLNYPTIGLSIFILLFGSIGGFYLKRHLKRHIASLNDESLRNQLSFPLLCVLEKYSIHLIVLCLFTILTSFLAIYAEKLIYLTQFSYGAFAYLIFFMVAKFFFYPPRPADAFIRVPESIAKLMIFRLMFLATMCFLGFIVYLIGHEQIWNAAIAHLFSAIFITAVAVNLICVIWLINRIPKLLHQYRVIRIILSITLIAGLVTIWLAEWLDYHSLALYLLIGIALTFISGFLLFFISKIIFTLLDSIMSGDRAWQVNLRYHLGIKKYQNIPEFVWLRAIAYVILWGIFTLLLFKIWGLSAIYLSSIITGIIYGFNIVQLTIVPLRIIVAALLFTYLILTTRWLHQRMKRRTAMEAQRGEQEALATITGYIGFSVALLFTLLIAGVNFAGLAFIAGALSVGIGFGLQNLAKDFISGLILLLERPVKIGDRIIVGQTEGYVKKISIRATQISTTTGTDVVVPNSEFTSTQVTNLMYHDDSYRISIPINVAYGSNTELVKETLLTIVNSHPETVKTEGVEPIVYFLQFAESTLAFELWCTILDVNRKALVRSELNFEIDKKFRELGINMAYPQRDIHIRSWPQGNIGVNIKSHNNEE